MRIIPENKLMQSFF